MFRRPKPLYYRLLHSYLFMLVIWLFTGFAIGTLILLFPLRAWVNYVRESDLSSTTENAGVVIMMLILAVVSFVISFRLFKWHTAKRKGLITLVSLLIPMLCAAGALALFMNPDLVNSGSESSEVSKQFTIGPYPTASKVQDLKKQGFTGIISLLHPAVVPFEPSLLSDEEKATAKAGIQLVKAPMLPWVGDNTASLKTIEEIVKSGKGKYYIHCYLGKDRVNVVKNLIARVSGDFSSIDQENPSSARTFEKQRAFERGDIYKLDENIYMPPFPTDEELLSFFLAGQVKTVVNLMDSTDADNKRWVRAEKKELDNAGLTFKSFAVTEATGAKKINAIIDSILTYQKPLVVHHWGTHFTTMKNFREAFYKKTGKTPINLTNNVPETY